MGLSGLLFGLTMVAYALAAAVTVWGLYYREREIPVAWAGMGAWLIHSTALVVRTVELGHPPLLYLFEAVLVFSWLVMLNYLVLDYVLRLRALGVFVVPAIFLLMMGTATIPRGAGPLTPALGSFWVTAHVLLAILGYGAFALSFVAGLMYVIQERLLRNKVFHVLYHRFPALEDLDALGWRPVLVGFPLLTLAILSGAISAGSAWGRYWGWEFKETWSLVTWVIYAAYLVARWGGWQGRRAAFLSIAGFLAVLFNLFAVNMFITQLHRFGF